MNLFKKLLSLMLTAMLLSACALIPTQPTVSPEVDGLTVHFLDVGQADCALLECGGEYILIDGGNVEDSSAVVSYLQRAGVEELVAVFCSHAHEDHVGGLPGVLAVYPTEAVYAPTSTYSSDCFDNFVYYADQQGLSITIPPVGHTMTFGGAGVEVLGPVTSYADTNNTSLVLMVTYGNTRFLFTGDMETTAETDLIEYGTDLKADVLKVGHHGSDTSSGYRFIYEVMPAYAVISVGKGNSYGHPNELPLSRLRDAGTVIYRTDELGNVIAHSDGSDITFRWEKTNQPITPSQKDPSFIGNRRSKKFHTNTCSSLPKDENRVLFDSYEDAVQAGYTPCGQCLG